MTLEFESSIVPDARTLADWCVTNTALSFPQIADFCGLDIWLVHEIADGNIPNLARPTDPIFKGLVTAEEIENCASDPESRIRRKLKHLRNDLEFSDEIDDIPVKLIPVHHQICKVYFLHYGRTAWHGTWIERYYRRGCVFGKLESAQHEAESNRVQGSIFYIDQLAALALSAYTQTLVVTEINSKREIDRLLKRGAPDWELHRVARWCSQAIKDSIIGLSCNENVELESLGNDELLSWKSTAQGATYLLDWKTTELEKPDRNAIRRLLKWIRPSESYA